MKANLTFRSSASHVDSLEQGLITQTSVSALALHGHLRSESSIFLTGGRSQPVHRTLLCAMSQRRRRRCSTCRLHLKGHYVPPQRFWLATLCTSSHAYRLFTTVPRDFDSSLRLESFKSAHQKKNRSVGCSEGLFVWCEWTIHSVEL